MSAYVIFKFNPDYDVKAGIMPYTKVAVYNGKTARDALSRYAADNGIEIGDGPASGLHWFQGRKHLASFGSSQFHANKTTLPQYIEEAI